MTLLIAKPSKPMFLIGHLLLLSLVLILEKFVIGAQVFGAVKEASNSSLADFLFLYGKGISRTITLSLVVFIVLIQGRIQDYRKNYVETYSPTILYFLPVQVLSFLLFYFCTEAAFLSEHYRAGLQIMWVVVGITTLIFTLLSAAGTAFWKTVVAEQKWMLITAVALSACVWWISKATQNLWTHLSDLTFTFVAQILFWVNGEVYVEPAERIIGLNDFLVNIAAQCSGYEGIGLITAFVAVFLYSFRRDFKFPVALLLFPIGAVVIWLFNVLRIVVLINIGSAWSEDVAVWGFHTQAGWITFIMTSVGIMWLAHNSHVFAKQRQVKSKSLIESVNLPIATLLPLIALLATTFLTQAFSGQFDWLYPIRVVVTGGVIFFCIKYLDIFPLRLTFNSVAAGILVAVIWVRLVAVDTEVDEVYRLVLNDSGSAVALLWLTFRFLGSVITVPIAEELGFRAYLLCRLSSVAVTTRGNLPFSVLGFVVSSVAFGLLHGAWLAGTVAGLIYALVRYHSSHVFSAAVAHGVTNMLLFIYVIYSGHWSLL